MSDEERFATLIRNLRVGVVIQRADSQIALFNPAARELLGLSEAQLLGRSSYDPAWRITREDGTAFRPEERPVAMVVATRRAVRNVVMCIHRPASDDHVWLMVDAEPELNPDGSVREVIATLVDISERKQLEASLLQAQKLESMGRLAGGIAHDFNNILTVISGSIELAMRSLPGDARQRRELGLGLDAAARAAALTKQLLIFARQQASAPTIVDVAEGLRKVTEIVGRLLGDNIVLSLNVAPDLWPVWIDPTQLEQVLLNLGVNARDAMPSGGHLLIAAENVVCDGARVGDRAGAFVRIRVTDTGHGMSANTCSHVFEPFFTTKGAHGTGLGLATVHGIVEQHGGYVQVESALGEGTTFSVYLPASRASLAERRRAAVPEGRWAGHETVLVAEDNDGVRYVAVNALRAYGYEVLEARDGQDALEVARNHAGVIHLLLSDVIMPNMDGPTLAEQLRRERPLLRVLFTSGYSEAGRAPPAARLVAKPYGVEDIAREVRHTLDE